MACSNEDCAAAIPIALAPTTANPMTTAMMPNWLVLRGITDSTSRSAATLSPVLRRPL